MRHRENRFSNRKASKPEGWFAPSIKHKLDSQIRFIKRLAEILPISKINIEVTNFNIQKIKDPSIEGEKYQEGEQQGFWNLREYILHRDNHKCQNPDCNNKGYGKNTVPLQVHHIGYWKDDMSDRPSNLITLCVKCHTPTNHNTGNLLYGWEPELESFKAQTFMSMVCWRMVNRLEEEFNEVDHTYGHLTKSKRIDLGLEKSHSNDAFVIAGGITQKRDDTFEVIQIRRNNRSLEKFYNAKYLDLRDGKKKSGSELAEQRRKRNTENNINLRVHRGHKIKTGGRSIRKKRYPFQPNDVVIYDGDKTENPIKCRVKGAFNKGKWVGLKPMGKPSIPMFKI